MRFIGKWKSFLPAILFPSIIYIVWDMWFTDIGIWSFNAQRITGIYLLGLPLEEILFFFIVPYGCLFIYACQNTYFPKIICSRLADSIFLLFGILLVLTGFIFYDRLYTCITFLSAGAFIIATIRSGVVKPGFNSKRFLLVFGMVMIPFLLINGLLTKIPVVLYNDTAITGLRIYTIPVEDLFYEMLLFLWNVVIYEWLEYKSR